MPVSRTKCFAALTGLWMILVYFATTLVLLAAVGELRGVHVGIGLLTIPAFLAGQSTSCYVRSHVEASTALGVGVGTMIIVLFQPGLSTLDMPLFSGITEPILRTHLLIALDVCALSAVAYSGARIGFDRKLRTFR